ncbi:MAG: GreA/GreB family elongation factor [Candidatus Limimorpha sp.]
MSRGFVKDGDQEEVPMVTPRAYLPKGVANYVTAEGLKALNEERESLVSQRVSAGDNYIARNFIDAKLKLLDERINSAQLVDTSKAAAGIVAFGSYVRYNDSMIRIVGVDEADAAKGLVSFISPVAKALIGRKVGDKFEMRVPKGVVEIEVLDVSFVKFDGWKSETVSSQKHLAETKDNAKPKEMRPVEISLPKNKAVEDKGLGGKEETSFKDILYDDAWGFLPLVSERGAIVGRAINADIHNGNKLLHPSVHLHVRDTDGRVVAKYWWHVPFGEKPEKTVVRKVAEVLGADTKSMRLKKQYIRETKAEKELVSVYVLVTDEPVPTVPSSKGYDDVFAKD